MANTAHTHLNARRPRAARRRRAVVAFVLALSAALVAAGGAAGTAHAAPEFATPVRNVSVDFVTDTYQPDRIALHRQTRVYLPAGTYTYGQRYAESVTHDIPFLTVPAGEYTLHDALSDEMGQKVHISYLDPAPDPRDPASGVILNFHPIPVVPGDLQWGSMLIPEP